MVFKGKDGSLFTGYTRLQRNYTEYEIFNSHTCTVVENMLISYQIMDNVKISSSGNKQLYALKLDIIGEAKDSS